MKPLTVLTDKGGGDYQAPKAPEHFRIYVSDSLAETIKRRPMDGFAVEEKRNDRG